MRSICFRQLCVFAALAVISGCSNTAPVVSATACLDDSECPAGESCSDAECKPCPTCGDGEVCIAASCLPVSCGEFVCPPGTGCADGRCVNSQCARVSCGEGEACVAGVCRPTGCASGPCRAGEYCVDGVCVTAACIGVTCPAGSRCEQGQCLPCPGGQCCTGPEACGVNGVCQRSCNAGTLGPCQPSSGPVDTQTDVSHCGECGNSCPLPVHATAKCSVGQCGRTPCEPGYFDLDGPLTPGCEATCDGGTCALPDGGTQIIHSTLIPETGFIPHGLAGGTAVGGLLQTNPEFTNQAVLGEGMPLPAVGGPLQTNAQFKNHGGFVPALAR